MYNSPSHLLIKDFDYKLPDEKIAKYPLQKRDNSRLLVYKKGLINEDVYLNIADYLPANSQLIFNNTKVIEARLLFKKLTGTIIEIFCLEPGDDYDNITRALLQHKKVLWQCLVGNAKKWKDEVLVKTVMLHERAITVSAKKIRRQGENFLIEFFWNEDISFAEILQHAGVIPLPPYLHRGAEEDDKARYQTVYAKHDGSVAAPTAGLHFTDALLEKLSAKNIMTDFVTLHVGAGTFMPVKTEKIEGHEMHSELFEADFVLIEKLLSNLDKTIVAVGTTSLRTIETLYWMGVKICETLNMKRDNIPPDEIQLRQWDAYELNANISVTESLNALLEWMKAGKLDKLVAKTQIMIAPPYKLKIANALITNFHQPKSTLLLLVAAVIGEDWRKVYDYALNNNFRFLSYGDGCLLFV